MIPVMSWFRENQTSEHGSYGLREPIFILGPCMLESLELCHQVAQVLVQLREKYQIYIVFKGSFDKANRTAYGSPRGPGLELGIEWLQIIRQTYDLPVTTDIHIPEQAEYVAQVVDIIQIPSFLSRQTDLITAAAKTRKVVNIKKGQFLSPDDIQTTTEKIKSLGYHDFFITERGTFFGYHDLVNDFRSIPKMKQWAPVIFDVTHSMQQPSKMGNYSGGIRKYAPILARAAASVGVDGFFIETHPQPDQALSDSAVQFPLAELGKLIDDLVRLVQFLKTLYLWHDFQ